MANLTGADYRSFIVVLAALVVFAGGVLSLIKNWRELRKPRQDTASDFHEWRQQVDKKLDNDNKRLNDNEKCNKVMMQSQLAILNHLITGDGNPKLIEASDKINDYLVNR